MKHGNFPAEQYICRAVAFLEITICKFLFSILLLLIQNGLTYTFSSILKGSYQNCPILHLGGPN